MSVSRSVEFLVEEPSITPYIDAVVLARRAELNYSVRAFNGKEDLLRKLPQRLRGYSQYAQRPQVVVLVDQDRDDCRVLKSRLEDIAIKSGLATKSSVAPGADFEVCSRIVVQELEAWALADEVAVRRAFPKVPSFSARATFRHPDQIEKPSKHLERLLQRNGYYDAGLAKLDCAQRVASYLDVAASRSPSFRAFAELLPSLGQ